MFNWKDFQKNKVILSQDPSYSDVLGQHHVTTRPINLIRWIEMCSEDLGFLTLVDIAAVDLAGIPNHDYHFELNYHLLSMGSHQRLNIHVKFDQSETLPSIAHLFTNADWLEREQRELLGVHFNRQLSSLLLPKGQVSYPLKKRPVLPIRQNELPEPLPIIRTNPNKSEDPYPEEGYIWKHFGLLSPFSLGLFEWDVCFDPQKIVDSKIQIGFHHQGLEKLFESKDWQQVLQLVDKVHFGASPNYSIAWAKTIEDFMRIKIPERAQAIRIVILELARIAEHLTVMHELTFALELDEHKLFINAREKIYELVEKYCGRRQGFGMARLGGVKEDLPHGWIVEYQSVCDIVTKALLIIHRSLLGQKLFRDQLVGAEVSAQTALQSGIGGPAMRACGLNFDLRKSQPFYFYQDIDFDIPVGIHGTSYERYLVRYEEIHQSFRIITQVIDNLPLGEIMNVDFDRDYIGVKSHIESLDFSDGWQYTGIEAPNGECGFMVMFSGKISPYRLKIKTPSFSITQALPLLLLNLKEDQIRPCLASLGIRQSELDR